VVLKTDESKGFLVGLVHLHYHGGYDTKLLEFFSEGGF
jgi:hypothetical protein